LKHPNILPYQFDRNLRLVSSSLLWLVQRQELKAQEEEMRKELKALQEMGDGYTSFGNGRVVV